MARRTATAPPLRVARWSAAEEAHRRRACPTTYAQVVRDIVLQTISRRVCAGPGCELAVLQDADGKSFPVCGRCRVPRYCSRECQRRDWRGEGGGPGARLIPHRQSCGVLAKIEAHKCPKLSLREFEAMYARAEKTFDVVDVLMLSTFVCSSGHDFGNQFRMDQIMEFPTIKGARPMTEEESARNLAQFEELRRSGALDELLGRNSTSAASED